MAGRNSIGTCLQGERGINALGLIFLSLLVGTSVYLAFRIFPFYYSYYEITGLMEAQAAKASVFTDDEMRTEILARIKKLEIPLDDPEDLKINRFSGKIVIELTYTEVLDIDLGEERQYDLWEFEFNPRAEHKL